MCHCIIFRINPRADVYLKHHHALLYRVTTETRYANIERELLAIVFACQHFSTYLLGRSFIAESDHKPLEMIAMKNLANAPPRLQRMLLELQRYDVTIKY